MTVWSDQNPYSFQIVLKNPCTCLNPVPVYIRLTDTCIYMFFVLHFKSFVLYVYIYIYVYIYLQKTQVLSRSFHPFLFAINQPRFGWHYITLPGWPDASNLASFWWGGKKHQETCGGCSKMKPQTEWLPTETFRVFVFCKQTLYWEGLLYRYVSCFLVQCL